MPIIVFEGIDGCGKSTQMDLLIERLNKKKCIHKTYREPGSTELGETVRNILLNPETNACAVSELFLYQVARAQLVHEKIKPALAKGEYIILDRFYYSTLAYQAYALDMDMKLVRSAIDIALDGTKVDKVFLLKIDPVVAAERRHGRNFEDRIEMRGLEYLKKVQDGYDSIASEEEMIVLDASDSVESLSEQIWSHVEGL